MFRRSPYGVYIVVGFFVGDSVGDVVGLVVGAFVGDDVGAVVGLEDGAFVSTGDEGGAYKVGKQSTPLQPQYQ